LTSRRKFGLRPKSYTKLWSNPGQVQSWLWSKTKVWPET